MTQNTKRTNQDADVFSPYKLGPLHLPNRLVMAPMTRNRAGPREVPGAMAVNYYVQRASAGLIVTEGTQVSQQGQGYPGTPGIFTQEQVAGWRRVTDAVHAALGRIFLQLWHVGRISHPSLQPSGAAPVAPSALQPAGTIMTTQGAQSFVTPRALETYEIAGVVDDYRRGAANARLAGFDGVELHGANGYLVDQFLRDKTNQRTDRYGGSAINRTRFLIEATEALVGEWGGERVGVRLAPTNPFNDIADSNPAATFSVALGELKRFGLAYLHIVEPGPTDPVAAGERPDIKFFRRHWSGTLMGNKGYDLARANAALRDGMVDLVSFAALFLANPDLPQRFRRGGPFNPPDRATFYASGEKGYTDYPALPR
jgi:N-ethylmaleimide reductase